MLPAKKRKLALTTNTNGKVNTNGQAKTSLPVNQENGKAQVVLYGKSPLEKELDQFASAANQHHLESRRAMDGVLEHAYKAGDALIAAKQALGVGLPRQERKVFGETRGRFGRWLAQNFRASNETARIYMRVARKWNDPAIINARADGLKISTLNEFIDLVKPPPDPAAVKKPKQKKRSKLQMAMADFKNPQPSDEYLHKRQIVAWVKEELEVFDEVDAEVMWENFDAIWVEVFQKVKLLRKQRKTKKPTAKTSTQAVNGKPAKKIPK